jgi:hypothetical protein
MLRIYTLTESRVAVLAIAAIASPPALARAVGPGARVAVPAGRTATWTPTR